MPQQQFKLVLSKDDGWHRTETDGKDVHYFYKGKSLCGKFTSKPEDAAHDNVEAEQCKGCKDQLHPMARGELEPTSS